MSTRRVWRITNKRYADSAFSGEGARLWGGRFNSPKTPAVYTSSSISLALLEILVQTNDRSNLEKMILFHADIPINLIQIPSPDQLPEQWDHIPVSKASQLYGDEWISNKKLPALRIPSVVVPLEFNYVINPQHELINQINISDSQSLPLDSRFYKS